MKSTAGKKCRRRGLIAQLGGLLCLAGLVSGLLFLALKVGGGVLMWHYLQDESGRERHVEEQIAAFQDYVTQHNLSTGDVRELTEWVSKNPLILMEIYRSNVLLYTSLAPEESSEGENDLEAPYYDWVSYYEVEFSDGPADVVLYSGEAYQWSVCLTIASLALAFAVFLVIFILGIRRLVNYICLLSDQIQAMEGGDLDQEILIRGNHELSTLARGLDSMRASFREQREREKELYRNNQIIITQMSHDLRTPLTAIQIYTDILRYRKFENSSQAEEYLNRIDGKISQIKQLAENIFEYSMVGGEPQVRLEASEAFREIFHDPLSEMAGYLEGQGFRFQLETDWPEGNIRVYAPYIKRLMDNITSNLVKYANPAQAITVAMTAENEEICFTVTNAVSPEASSQTSSGIGLSNMRAMMEKMMGTLETVQTEGVFQITLRFPLADARTVYRNNAENG